MCGLLACGVRIWNTRISSVFVITAISCFCCIFAFQTRLHSQMTDEEKRQLFLKAREDIRPVPKASPSSTPRPKPRPAATPRATPNATPRPTSTSTPRKISTPVPTPTPAQKLPTPAPKPALSPAEDIIRIPNVSLETPVPSSTVRSTPSPQAEQKPQIPRGTLPSGQRLDAPILIEKSGLQDDAGYEPPRRPVFGGFTKRWRYLTPTVRKAIDGAKVKRGRWKYIIIHNSGTRQGNARIFDLYHRRVRKMQNGLAYHFVIGNGSSSGNGEIEIGQRWIKQINGGHVASNYLNDIAIGICLVGDLNRDQPTQAQLAALDELCTYLRARVGKVKGRPAIVKGHKEINPKPTDCPGDRFPLTWLRKRFGN